MKWIIGVVSAIVGFVTMANVASVEDRGSSYAEATEEQKQKRLESLAKGFKAGFRVTAGSKAEITQTYVDASADLVSFSVQLKDPKINDVPYEQVDRQRIVMLKQMCALTDKKGLLETDFTMRVRFYRPGGGKLMTLEVDGENCGPYVG